MADNNMALQIELGCRISFQLNGATAFGVVYRIHEIYLEVLSNYDHPVLYVLTDTGDEIHFRENEHPELRVVMSALEWSRQVLPHLCRDLVQGNVGRHHFRSHLMLSCLRGRHGGLPITIDDVMAQDLGEAIHQSSHLKSIKLIPTNFAHMTNQGVDTLAQGIASSTSIQRLELHDLGKDGDGRNDGNVGQVHVDTLCRRVQGSSSIKCLCLLSCTLPQQDAFRELCNSHVQEIWFSCCSESDGTFQRELYKFSSLKFIDFGRNPNQIVKGCLLGLVDHPGSFLIISYCDTQFLDNLEVLLQLRQRKALPPIGLELSYFQDCNALLDVVIQHDALKLLDLDTATIDGAAVIKIQKLIGFSKNLQKLILPQYEEQYRCENEDLLGLLLEIQKGTNLSDFSIAAKDFEAVLLPQKGNKSLRTFQLIIRYYGTQVVDNLEVLLQLRQRKALPPIGLKLSYIQDCNALLHVVIQHDALKLLDLNDTAIDGAAVIKIQKLIGFSKNLQKLILPQYEELYLCEKEDLLGLLPEIQKSTNLSDFSIAAKDFEAVLLPLKGNKSLRTLTFNPALSGPTAYNFQGLRYIQGLHSLFVFDREREWQDLDAQSLVTELKLLPSLEEVRWNNLDRIPGSQRKIHLLLKCNRWFNRNSQTTLKSPDSIARGLWPHVLGRVSLSTSALHSLVRGYPAIVENGSSSGKY